MDAGARHVARARRAVARAHRDVRGPAERGHHGQSEGARRGRRARSRARAAARSAGRCTAFPIALKDNIHTTDMPTTGGALAFDGLVPPYEATLTKQPARRRRDHHRQDRHDRAGQLGRDRHAGQLQRARGYGMNPYDPRRDPREATADGRPVLGTGGSSSGIGTAASFWAANVGTETSGSILSPANENMLVGIKPTVGRDQPLRRHSDHRRSGHAGPDGADGDRRGDPAGRARRAPRPIRTTPRRARARRRPIATTRRSCAPAA